MTILTLLLYILKFFIPTVFSILFRALGLGYKSKRSLTIGLCAFGIYTVVVPTVLIILIGYEAFTDISMFVMIIANMLPVLIFSTDKPVKTIFFQLVQGNVMTAIAVVFNMIRHQFALSYYVLIIMLLISCLIIYFFTLKFWAKPMRFMLDNMPKKSTHFLAIPILTLFIVCIIPTYPDRNFTNHPIYCTAIMLAVELAFMLYIYAFYGSLREIRDFLKEKSAWVLVQSEIASCNEHLEELKHDRHDLRHHNAVILEYLDNGDVKMAKKYLNEQNDSTLAVIQQEYCKNSVCNAVFKIYERRANNKNISFTVIADIPPMLAIKESDLGAMLSNILENACEACEKSSINNPQISVCVTTDNECLLIELRNTVGAETKFNKGMPVSQKPGGGIGTRSIKGIAHKYNGMVEYSQRKNVFLTRIILPI